jgi:hypothetical protein
MLFTHLLCHYRLLYNLSYYTIYYGSRGTAIWYIIAHPGSNIGLLISILLQTATLTQRLHLPNGYTYPTSTLTQLLHLPNFYTYPTATLTQRPPLKQLTALGMIPVPHPAHWDSGCLYQYLCAATAHTGGKFVPRNPLPKHTFGGYP